MELWDERIRFDDERLALAVTETVPELMGKLYMGRATALVLDGQVLALGQSISVGGQKGFILGFIAWSPSFQVRFNFIFFHGLKLYDDLGGAWLGRCTRSYHPQICLSERR
jgi:hypothetical protein